jgi:DNA mismatch repair ATPase MutS
MHTICKELQQVTPFQYTGSKLLQLGKIMRIYYLCNTDRAWKETIQYSIYFNSYIHSLSCIKDKLHKSLHFCKYSKKKTYFKGIYYPHIEKELVVHNDVCLSTNIIITGPNAAGKTTLLKTIMLNTILCQQFGCGYFNKARLQPYHVLSSYINIPDTSERESLFQAEAVRCKTILDDILCNKERRHLCIFDELFSGTNPYEATSAAKAYLKYIHKQNNVRFLLTTHFVDMCKQLKDECDICNMHMQVEKDMHHSFIYTYRILKGISSVKGGVKVLNDLNYPQEIIKDCLCEINRHN